VKNEFVVLSLSDELPFREVSDKSHEGSVSGVAPHWRCKRNRLSPMRNASYIGKLVGARVHSRTARGLLALISLAINLCVVSIYIYIYIYIYTSYTQERKRRKKRAAIQDHSAFRPVAIPPMSANVFAVRATARRQYP